MKKQRQRARRKVTPLVRLLIPHSKDCDAVAAVASGQWSTPLCVIPVETRWMSARGDKRGRYTPWLLIRCNSTNCGGQKIVKAEVLEMAEPNATGERPLPAGDKP